MALREKPQRGLEPTNLPITSRLRYLLRHWGIDFAQYGPARWAAACQPSPHSIQQPTGRST